MDLFTNRADLRSSAVTATEPSHVNVNASRFYYRYFTAVKSYAYFIYIFTAPFVLLVSNFATFNLCLKSCWRNFYRNVWK